MRPLSSHCPPTARKHPRGGPPVRPAVEALEDRSLLGLFGAPIPFAVGPNPGPVAVADGNGDGRPDLVVATNDSAVSGYRGNGMVNVLLRTAGGTYAPPIAS